VGRSRRGSVRWQASSDARPAAGGDYAQGLGHVPCTFFKAVRKLVRNAPNAKLIVRCARGYIKLSTEVMTSRNLLSRSLYTNGQKRLCRHLFKLTRNDVDSNNFASNPKSDLRDVLANYPCPWPHICYRRSQNVL